MFCNMDTITLGEQSIIIDTRLGKCEVCNFNLAKYTCPKCEVKTCKVECVRIHKKELNCDGIRDKTKYIPLRQITEGDLIGDYSFLETCTNYASARRTDKIKRFTSRNRSIPVPRMKLKKAAADSERQITLNFLLPNFDKHKRNTSFFNCVSKVIYWCIEWRFINANNKILIDERCSELQLMNELIAPYFDYSNSISSLACYRSQGLQNVALLLKAEGVRKSKNRFYDMDMSKTLKENLNGKILIEYPVIFVVYKSQMKDYDVINGDEENVMEETRKHKNHYFPNQNQNQTKKVADEEDENDESLESVKYNSLKPVNFLFSNGNGLTDSSSDET